MNSQDNHSHNSPANALILPDDAIRITCHRPLSKPMTTVVIVQLSRIIPTDLHIDLEWYRAEDKVFVRQQHQKTEKNRLSFHFVLSPGLYYLSVGLFTADWKDCLWWKDNIQFLRIPERTQHPRVNDVSQAAHHSYWRFLRQYAHGVQSDQLKIVRPQNDCDTVSEGMAYGLLLALAHNDRKTFDRLWQYVKSRLNNHGLMPWHFRVDDTILDRGSAADADQDIAFALIAAGKRWHHNDYQRAGIKLIHAIRRWDTAGSNMKPGDQWSNANIINPSYICPHYYSAFYQATNDRWWRQWEERSLRWLSQLQHPSSGLWPDWYCQNSQVPCPYDTNIFSYEAVRIPWRIYWAINQDMPILAPLLQAICPFFVEQALIHLRNSYTLSGQPLTQQLSGAFVAVSALVHQFCQYRSFPDIFTTYVIEWIPETYYDAVIQSLVLSTLAGFL
ncbi:glycosyl hydrolase family 8 [Sulfobacillus thermosulfidooxidans]|uniref:glycosyl hydrolase family 8 n=1 Tax=Sulfobacillus thermosulfidooxidans TaxID=28034 RepID=UPI00096B8642|nr:glycosyl hydrolase family 8 [Sulfobacillus thermosulfidooxidans]OLZ11200.1 hypothetical protein BFX05_07930 [Sulfobacillus thermosulfidooxidans]OLZ13461.1 hypothetical protein BFX06_09835 [Sulfobacillus thermosulfidooxidans]OLZ21708.1 hypothetical protein BFX07_12885 [Sulfobacillus thermosulfidooxidans]